MDKRVKFDFEIDFTNGGGIQGQDFRLDIAGDDISDQELADTLVEDMRLLMVGAVRILNKEMIVEAHKRKPFNADAKPQRFVDLSPVMETQHDLDNLFDLDAIMIRAYGVQAVDYSYFVGKELRGRAVLVYTGWHDGLDLESPPFITVDAAEYLKEVGVKLVGLDSPGLAPVHVRLREAGIMVMEQLCNLEKLPEEGFTFSIVPSGIQAFARISQDRQSL